ARSSGGGGLAAKLSRCRSDPAALLCATAQQPPVYPRYNGSIEHSMRDLQDALDRRRLSELQLPISVQLELATYQLNHWRLRCLGPQTPRQVYHDPARGLDCTELPARGFSVKSSSSLMYARTASPHHQRRLPPSRGNLAPPPRLDLREGKTP